MKGDALSLQEIQYYARSSGVILKDTSIGPYLRVEATAIGDISPVGYLTAFIRPWPPGLMQLETIQVKNRRQTLDFKTLPKRIDGPGVSFILGAYSLSWAKEKGCRRAQLLAVKDSEAMEKILIRLYESFGFFILKTIEDNVTERIVWVNYSTNDINMINFDA